MDPPAPSSFRGKEAPVRRIILVLTAAATLLAGLATSASARQPEDLVPFLDIALTAKLHASERAQEVVGNPPGQSEDRLAERAARHQERLERFADHPGRGVGSERSLEVHEILAAGCATPDRGDGKKLGHAHKFATCDGASPFVPPGQAKEKPAGDDTDEGEGPDA